ncbi:23698_t:CDS:2 [Cetraspora pellucida]|uniref:23698_t:CDS:1 n=1 Tax=Cetraspora pellucida TaxID=1433469 RepID=A0A9N8W726_9GLOM|nr:23698_t:CDS:2 [Cetraspora pellucida]
MNEQVAIPIDNSKVDSHNEITQVLWDEIDFIISDYIIKVCNDDLQIQSLVKNENFNNYLRNELEDGKIYTYSCGKQIWQIIQNTLESYQPNQYQGPSITNYPGKLCTWNVNHTKNFIFLEASEKKTNNQIVRIKLPINRGGKDEFHIELLKSDDLMLISSFGIYIWTVKNNHDGNYLLYYWDKGPEPEKALIKQLNFLKGKFDFENLPPSPSFDQIIYRKSALHYIIEHSEDIIHHETVPYTLKNEDYDEASQPYLSLAILKIAEYKNINEHLDKTMIEILELIKSQVEKDKKEKKE